jgi:hypothetical protein
MNRYQVTIETGDHAAETIDVAAVSGEQARYKAFDEAVDRGCGFSGFAGVMMWDDSTDRWVRTREHAPAR